MYCKLLLFHIKIYKEMKYYIKVPGLGGIEVGFDMRAGPVVIVAVAVGE